MDTVVYETKNKPAYVIQFETENHNWVDTYPTFWSEAAAIKHLEAQEAAAYPYRIVKRERR